MQSTVAVALVALFASYVPLSILLDLAGVTSPRERK
jgi:hypothetical protein